MKASGINDLWSKLVVAELIRCGVSEFCVSPGSRSTSLALAVAENEDASAVVHFDERGSAFRALGFAKATGKPAVLICTSGTAPANYYPAIVEASQSATPMIILSADRPAELRNTGASQTVNQVGMFGEYLRWSVDLFPPDIRVSPEFLLTTVDQSVRASLGPPAGPVQLNFQIREPLTPLEQAQDYGNFLAPLGRWNGGTLAYTTNMNAAAIDESQIEAVVSRARRAQRGVIVAGNLPASIDATSIIELADRWQWPLIADICSGVRFAGRDSKNIIRHADLYLRNSAAFDTLRPDCVLQFGTSPISKAVTSYAASASAHYILVIDRLDRIDPHHRVTLRLASNPVQLAKHLHLAEGISKSDLLESIVKCDSLSAEAVQKMYPANADSLSELQVAAEIARITPTDRGLFLATSMPIREFDSVAQQSDHRLHIAANRGANGIDGTIASAVGFSDGLGLPVTLLIGDLAALHDLNSLALVRQSRFPLTIVILNNDGGGIFSLLPIADHERHFEEFFGTPHGLEFRNAAEMFGIKYHFPNTPKDFSTVYRHSLKSKKPAIIEIACSRGANALQHKQTWKAVQEKIEKYITK